MKSKKIIYYLTVGDIQTVAIEVLERKLTADEIEKLIEPIGEKLNWYDAIEYSINEKLI